MFPALDDRCLTQVPTAEQSALNSFCRAKGAEHRHGERRSCLKGTREVVLNAIELWARDPTKSPVYWLNGLAGTGKSTIAKTIAERLFSDGQLGASFFCSRDFEDRRNIQLIFPTLAAQLARKYIEFRKILVPLIQRDPEIAHESLHNQMTKLIVQPLNESDISTVIVIDALDECEDEEPASAILSVLGKLVSGIPKVKFFLTGRPDPRINEGFRLPLLAKVTDVFVLHRVEPDQVDSDIRLFFRTSFLELASRRGKLDNWPAEEQLDHLCRRAAGLFVYAATTIKFVDNNKKDPRKQLDLLLQSQKIGSREGKTLDTLYASILREAFGDDGPEDDARTRSVIGAVILAVNPLSPSAIATLLGYDTEDVPLLLSSISSLLIIQEDASYPVRPFHKSFPDFVTDPDRCTNKRFFISPPDHHLQLLICCLDLMNRTLAKNMCKLPDGVANLDVSDLKERVGEFIDPALQYACLLWHTHLIDAETISTHAPIITPTLHQVLENKFLSWLEVLSVLGVVKNAVDSLRVITDWLEVCRVSAFGIPPVFTHAGIQESPTLDLANDCLRFVTSYFEVIDLSAPHIYHSALAFSPKTSIVRKLYESHARPFARVVRGLPMSWDGNIVATTRPSHIRAVVCSPCNRFIAIAQFSTINIEVLDSATLQLLQALEFPQEHGIRMYLTTLAFSPDSRVLTCSAGSSQDQGLSVVSWDIQTGGIASIIRWQGPDKIARTHSITYSANGKMVGVRCRYSAGDDVILVFNVVSGVYIHSHSLTGSPPHATSIWAHGESLRFTTTHTNTITIWEVGFTSEAIPTEVETIPLPEDVNFTGRMRERVRFLPTSSRLGLWSQGNIRVWDVQNSKYLLNHRDTMGISHMSFSDDGRFFACSAAKSGVYLWKESPTGYTLHQILASGTMDSIPHFSRDGESIVVSSGPAIQLWRTKGFPTTHSSSFTRTSQRTENFILDFSPDGASAAVVEKWGRTVTVLDLESGVPQLTIDAGVAIDSLRLIKNVITVAGNGKVITWDLPTGDRVPDVEATLEVEDSSRSINLSNPMIFNTTGTSISPTSHHVALTTMKYTVIANSSDFTAVRYLYIHDGSTGEQLAQHTLSGATPLPFFSPDGRDLWVVDGFGSGETFRVGGGGQVIPDPERRVDVENPPEGCPWVSSLGYRVTNDRWILGADGRRLLMLPPLWQCYAARRVWKGQFLALLHGGRPEPVILELNHS